MGQHKINVPDGNKPKGWWRSALSSSRRMLFLSKELIVVPKFGIGVDGKLDKSKPVGFEYALAAGGNVYRRDKRKPLSRRDSHRHNVGTNTPNDWGAEPYMLQRERQEAGARQREKHAEWLKLQKEASPGGLGAF